MLENPFTYHEDQDMKIRDAATRVADFLRSHKTLTRMLASFLVGFALGAWLF
jgi:hypothetical protein